MAHFYQSIDGWFDFDDIYELALRRCGSKPARFVEIGAYKGRSACYMAERIRETAMDIQFEVVDTFMGGDDVGHDDLWPAFAANFERAGLLSRTTVHRCPSLDAARSFADGSLDFIFIDADHSFEAAEQDLSVWWPKLRGGGLMAGHDYTNSPSVRAAVDAFVAANGLQLAFRSTRASWMIYRSMVIDATYCINLPHRADRRRQATAQFEKSGIHQRVIFFDATPGNGVERSGGLSDGQAGCCASHLNVLRAAKEAGYRQILVFEDDIVLAPDFPPRFTAALSRCPASFDLCYVGALCEAAWGNFLYPLDDLVSRIGSVCGTHAYIINMECQPAIEAGLARIQHVIDDWYAREIQSRGNCYGFTPWLGFQAPGYSDVARAYNANGGSAGYAWR